MIGFVCSRIFCQKLLRISLEASHSSIPRKSEFSRNYFLVVDEDSTDCIPVDIQEEMGGTFDYERGIDFQPKIYEFIFQQLCLGNDNNYFGCEDKGWVDSPNRENDDEYLYKLHLFEDITPEVQFAFSRLGLFIQFQNYSIGSYADGAPRIIIPNSKYFMESKSCSKCNFCLLSTIYSVLSTSFSFFRFRTVARSVVK